jgi:hypothetical protein
MQLPFKTSVKHVQINKANNTMLAIAAAAAVVTVFSLLSAKALLSQSSYQHRVLKEKNKAVKQLQENVDAAKALKTQFDIFEAGNPNIIGGLGGVNAGFTGPSDGDNARIVLDALPGQYDFPALTSSIEKIVNNDKVAVQGFSGTDAAPTPTDDGSSTSDPQTPVASPMAFTLTVTTDYSTSMNLIKDFERSIRPFDITNLTLSGSSSNMNVSIQANTYYQPAMSLQIGHKEVK